MNYCVHTINSAWKDTPYTFSTFAETLAFVRQRTDVVSVWRPDYCDYSTDLGWCDGLSGDERDALEE